MRGFRVGCRVVVVGLVVWSVAVAYGGGIFRFLFLELVVEFMQSKLRLNKKEMGKLVNSNRQRATTSLTVVDLHSFDWRIGRSTQSSPGPLYFDRGFPPSNESRISIRERSGLYTDAPQLAVQLATLEVGDETRSCIGSGWNLSS